MSKQTSTEIKAPRAGSKQAKLVAMLSRKSGTTIEKASQALGWLPHTTSSAMTGLRKRGYIIERIVKNGKPGAYVITNGADSTASPKS